MKKIQITVFTKLDGKLLSPFASICIDQKATKEVKEVSFDGMFNVVAKDKRQYFNVDQMKDTFMEAIKLVNPEKIVTFKNAHVQFIFIPSMPGSKPERLVELHNLTGDTSNLCADGKGEIIPVGTLGDMSGAATDVLYALFWRGPLDASDLPSKAGEAELIDLGYCERHNFNHVPKGRENTTLTILTKKGYEHAYDRYTFRTGFVPPLGLSL